MRNATIVAMLILMPILSPAGPCLAQTIVLRSQAPVDTEQVSLGQIARIHSNVQGEADALAVLVVGLAPAMGASSAITLNDLRSRLDALHVNRAVWSLGGAASCRVTRVQAAAQQLDELQQRSQTLREGVNGQIVQLPEERIPDSLAGVIRKALIDQLQPAGGRLDLHFAAADRSLLSLQRPQFRFEVAIRRVGARFVDVSARVYAIDPEPPGAPGPRRPAAAAPREHLVKSADLRVDAELAAPVVVAAKQINRGQVLAADDVRAVVRQVDLDSQRIGETAAVVGQQSKRTIRPEQVVGSDDLEPLALVHRNKLVTVWVRTGNLMVKTVGRAMQDGIYGQKIIVRNEATRQPFYAVVTGPDTVQLDPTPLQETNRNKPGSEVAASPLKPESGK
ncbi:MAG: hypothetical protein BIFFINMI_01342 [Phycisphaerae bacterium]|nr:hypothetical protein [Phycisphaerae bacterium]